MRSFCLHFGQTETLPAALSGAVIVALQAGHCMRIIERRRFPLGLPPPAAGSNAAVRVREAGPPDGPSVARPVRRSNKKPPAFSRPPRPTLPPGRCGGGTLATLALTPYLGTDR
jgi:hypothetical protein